MSQKNCANILKIIVVLAFIGIAAVYFGVAPKIAFNTAENYPEFAFALWPWLSFVLISCVPVFWALAEAWGIFTRIGNDRSFCRENAVSMRRIAILAAAESAYLLLGDIAMAVFVINHPGIFLFILILAVIAVMVCGVCWALSLLIKKASNLQEENDLTI